MPVTFPAHQAAVLPLKLRWPGLDGVALCIGSAAPDLSYALLGTRWQFDAHYTWAAAGWGIPITLFLCWWLRRGLFAYAPLWAPAGWVPGLQQSSARAWNVRNIGHAVGGAAIGIVSHAGWDAFTHSSSPLADHWRVLNRILITTPVPMTLARTLQYAGHTFGSVLALWLLVKVWRAKRIVDGIVDGKSAQRPGPATNLSAVPWRLPAALAFGIGIALLSNWRMPHEIAAALLRGFWSALLVLTVLVAIARRRAAT